MNTKSIYLKYKEERYNAKYLKKLKKNTWQIKKVARVRLERVDLNALMKRKPSVRVSLPIKYFNQIRSTMSNNHDGQKELPTPKDKIEQTVNNAVRPIAPATNLRMVHHQVVAAQHDTTAGTTMIKRIRIKRNLLPENDTEKKSKKIETYTSTNAIDTAAKANVMHFQKNEHISIKRKPTKDNNRIGRRDQNVNSMELGTTIPSDIIDTSAKVNVMPSQGDDHKNINYPYNPQKIDTAEKSNVIPYGIAHRKTTFANSKEVGTNTSTDIINICGMPYKHISIKHKLPVPVAPTKENYGKVSFVNSKHVGTSTLTDIINTTAKANEKIANVEVSSANEVKRCLKALVITSTQTDKIHIVNEKELKILGIVTKSGVTNDELVDALESFKKVKELSKYNVTEVIDLDGPADDNGAKLLELARFHSEKNKKAIYENRVRASNSTSTKSTPTPINLEKQKILEMRYKLITSMTYEQLKNLIDSQNKTNNKENSNKKRKTTEIGDNYDEANMEMEIDVPGTQTIMNQPVTVTPLPKPLLQKSTTQPRQMQPTKAQKQNKELNMLQLNSSPIQQIIRQDVHLERLHHQKMQQQQYLLELKQKNMRAKPKQPQQEQTPQLKNPHTQQPHSKSSQIWEAYTKSPQFQQPHSKSPPQFQQPHSKSPQIREQYSKNPQIEQPHSKSPSIQQPHSKSPQIREQYSDSPQIQQPHSKSPHDQQPQSQATELQEQLQHPLDRRIRIRDQQRAALPQQHYEFESASNGYQNLVFSQVPQTINSTQQPQFQLYHGDPRIQTFQAQMSQVMPIVPRLMSTYEANLQTARSSYPYQNNCYINQQYW